MLATRWSRRDLTGKSRWGKSRSSVKLMINYRRLWNSLRQIIAFLHVWCYIPFWDLLCDLRETHALNLTIGILYIQLIKMPLKYLLDQNANFREIGHTTYFPEHLSPWQIMPLHRYSLFIFLLYVIWWKTYLSLTFKKQI